MSRSFITHSHPVVQEAADSLILAKASLDPQTTVTEQLFALQTGRGRFEITCIPFYVLGLSLSDEVEVGQGRLVSRIVTKRGHKTLRIGIRFDENHALVHDWCAKTGLAMEWDRQNFVVLDLPSDTTPPDMSALAELLEAERIWFNLS